MQAGDVHLLAQLDALAAQLGCESRHQRLRADVAIDARAHHEARVVAERRLDLARRLGRERLDRPLEPERLEILEDRREPGDAVLAARQAEDAAAVHLELDAVLGIGVELAERARVEVEQRLHAVAVARSRAGGAEGPQPAQPGRVEPGADDERATRIERRAQPGAQDAGRRERRGDRRRDPARVALGGAAPQRVALEQHHLGARAPQRVGRAEPHDTATDDCDLHGG